MARRKKVGRPRVEISRDQFEKLCAMQCTLAEVAAYFGCSEDTIENWCKREYEENFSDVFRVKRGLGRVSLRRAQFRMADNNPTMAIWLGKQYLGQTDKQEVAVTTQDDDTIKEMEQFFLDRKAESKTEKKNEDEK